MAHQEKHGKTLFIRNLPYSTTNEDLEKIFSDVGPVKSCFVVGDKDTGKCRGFGYVKFTLMEDAQKALKNVKKVGTRNIQMMLAKNKEKKKKFGAPKAGTGEKGEEKEKEEEADAGDNKTNQSSNKKKKNKQSSPKAVPKKGEKQAANPFNEGKRARLIVRNLSFKCTENQLKEAFSKYGQVVEVHIPTKGAGKKLGFGFVQFSTKAEAGMAVKGGNGKSILDRKVAVDFTLPKEKFEKRAVESRSKADENEEEGMEVDQQSDEEEQAEEESDEEEDDMSDDQVEERKAKKFKASVNIDDDDEEEESEDDDEDEESEDDDEEEESEEDSEEEEDEDNESDSGIEREHLRRKRESDVSEGRTIFIRNLPYNITEEELQEYFSTFGQINYTRIVVDRETGMSRGTAFVQFKAMSSAESSLKGSGDYHELGGRELSVTMAVSREKAVELVGKKDTPKEQKDSRNLYLIREGMIRPGTEQAKNVPAADLVRRQKIDAQKRLKLKDQDVFVSSTRLCIHNLPTSTTDKQLRGIVLKAAGDKKAKLMECRIMRDLDRVNPGGLAKSRGYAFFEFTQHEHAIEALKQLNNNPETFGSNKRPIVEFSLESRRALETKQKRFEKSKLKQKQATVQTNVAEPEAKKRKKQKSKQNLDVRPFEVRKEQDKVARSLHKGSIGLPSHSGTKQRHKARAAEANSKQKKKPSFAKKLQQQPRQKESQKIPKELKQKSRRQKPDTDNFDKLVASYKKKILSTGSFS